MLLGVITAAASFLTDLGFVSAFAGALLGSAVIYLFPSIMFRQALRRKDSSSGGALLASARHYRLELLASHIITVVGLAFMVSGGAMTWLNKMGH